jgi:hypothetical protein
MMEGQHEEDMSANAHEEIMAQSLDAIREAERRSDMASEEGNMEPLQNDKLGPVPDRVKIKFSCVLGDLFHAMDRAKVPTNHEFKKAYYYALMGAFLEWDPNGLASVKNTLLDNGWTEEEFESTLFYKPSFFRRRVQRVALPPHLLYYRVRAVFVTFGDKLDSKSGRPLFNDDSWRKACNLLEEIKRGFYSDPPGFNFYKFDVDKKGEIKKDIYGIPLIRCCRGTNMVECVHRQYNTTFRHRSGIEMGDAQLSERRHRHNMDMAQKVYTGFPRVGHYDSWKIDVLQKLVEQNTGKFPKLPVQLKKYQRFWERNRRIQDAMDRAKSDIELLNSYISQKVPMELEHDGAGGESLSNGGHELENAHEEESGLVAALDDSSGEIGAMHRDETVNTRSNLTNTQQQQGMNNEQLIYQQGLITPMQRFALYMQQRMQAPFFPPMLPVPFPNSHERPADALPIAVAGKTITAMTGVHTDPLKKKRRRRGKDRGKRKAPTCVKCRNSTDVNIRNQAGECPGRYPREKCQNLN